MTGRQSKQLRRISWKGPDEWEQQESGAELNLEEGPDPLQFTLEDWVDQRRD
jgi:hypothetical protein